MASYDNNKGTTFTCLALSSNTIPLKGRKVEFDSTILPSMLFNLCFGEGDSEVSPIIWTIVPFFNFLHSKNEIQLSSSVINFFQSLDRLSFSGSGVTILISFVLGFVNKS